MEIIRLLQPTYSQEVKQAVLDVLDSGWTSFGPKVGEFERAFADRVGAKFAVATNSATSALDIAIKASGITGGELITPSFTFTSDAHVGEWNGMEVVFADINEDTFCIEPESLPLSGKTKVIIAVNSHGRLADIDGVRHKCDEMGKSPLIIEDSAHAILSPGEQKGDVVVYSFQAVKFMPIFDGGMITTNDERMYGELRKLTWLGIEQNTYERASGGKYSWDYDISVGNGVKAYMTNVQAAIGLAQLDRLDFLLEKRQAIQTKYNEAFSEKEYFSQPKYSRTVQYYTPKWEYRDRLNEYLSYRGIHTGMHFKPLHLMSYWKKAKKVPLPNTERVFSQILSLPCHDALTDEQQTFVINTVRCFYERGSL